MPDGFLDTSTLVKYYHAEQGSTRIIAWWTTPPMSSGSPA